MTSSNASRFIGPVSHELQGPVGAASRTVPALDIAQVLACQNVSLADAVLEPYLDDEHLDGRCRRQREQRAREAREGPTDQGADDHGRERKMDGVLHDTRYQHVVLELLVRDEEHSGQEAGHW